MTETEQIQQSLDALRGHFARELAEASSVAALEPLRVKYLGRKSELTNRMKQLGTCPADQRGMLGKALNLFKTEIETALREAEPKMSRRPAGDGADVTLPGVPTPLGRLHPITQTMRSVVECFVPLGFEVVQGPELECEWYNFDALNIPAEHPSRESFDTFFVDVPPGAPTASAYAGLDGSAPNSGRQEGKPLLRSHTSPVQVRIMQTRKPPLRIVVPGRVYRPDPLDASHSFMFHQVEGLKVDDHSSFADLKGMLTYSMSRWFGPSTVMRFRPHFFPFTEPSAEADIACSNCQGAGCSTCGRKGWLEILGCGMVHPNVLRAVGYDPNKVQGFAFGMGVERIAMLKHGISDIRLFFENDLRFLEQF